MLDLAPRIEDLEPIESASSDALRALQLERLRWASRTPTKTLPTIERASTRPACIPRTAQRSRTSRSFPFTAKEDLRATYPFGMFAVPRDQVAPHSCLERHDRAADGRRLHAARHRHLGRPRRALDPRCRRAAGRHRVHVAYGYGLFTGGLGAHYGAERLGCTVIPMSGGQTERQVQLILDFEPDIIMVTPSYMLAIARRVRAAGSRSPAAMSLKVGILGAEPWTEAMRGEIEGRARHACRRHLRPVGGDRAGRRAASASRPRTGCMSGKTTSIPRSSTRDRRGPARRRARASLSSPR